VDSIFVVDAVVGVVRERCMDSVTVFSVTGGAHFLKMTVMKKEELITVYNFFWGKGFILKMTVMKKDEITVYNFFGGKGFIMYVIY
jgi:hypothetical protein